MRTLKPWSKAVAMSLLLAATGFAAAAPVDAGLGSQVVVVYNSRLPESKSVADAYARKRAVPQDHVIGLPLSTDTDLSRAEFRETLQVPLARTFQDKQFWTTGKVKDPTRADSERTKVVQSKVRYLLLCYGVPFRVKADPTLKEEGTDSWRPEMRRNEASVDSELALLPLSDEKVLLSGPLRNPLFGSTNSATFDPTNGVLMVTRLDGPSAAIAAGLVDKAILAEQTGFFGRAYFDLRNTTDPKYVAGDDALRKASEICRRLGYETVVETNGGTFPPEFPMSHIGFYAGWYDENVSGPFARPSVEFMPGAFAYHLHSFSAASLRSTNRNWVGPLLAKGATLSMGTVDEPYLGGTPEIPVFTSKLLFEGFTFGEAAFASQSVLSWQIVALGDPLYRAQIKSPDALHAELVIGKGKMLEWSWLRLMNANLSNGRSPAEIAQMLEDADFRKNSAVLTEKLADLYANLGKPTSSIHTARQALKIAENPGQRLRLRLSIAERFIAQADYVRATEELEATLLEFPNHPCRVNVLRRLATMARNLGNTKQAEEYELKASAP